MAINPSNQNQEDIKVKENDGDAVKKVPSEAKVSEDTKKPEHIKDVKKSKKKRIGFKIFIIIISLANVLIVSSIFLLLSGAREKAKELKTLRNAAAGAEQKSKVEIADLEIKSNIEKSDYLMSLFPDETGLIDFVKEIEKLKTEGSVKDFSFANEDAVRDKTRAPGIPFILRMIGTWEEIDRDMVKLQEFPFLIRAVTIDISANTDTNGEVDLKYGGFLYVHESLEKNK